MGHSTKVEVMAVAYSKNCSIYHRILHLRTVFFSSKIVYVLFGPPSFKTIAHFRQTVHISKSPTSLQPKNHPLEKIKRHADLNHVMHDCAHQPMVSQASNVPMMDYFVHVSILTNPSYISKDRLFDVSFSSFTWGNLTILKRLCHSLIDTDLDLLYFN